MQPIARFRIVKAAEEHLATDRESHNLPRLLEAFEQRNERLAGGRQRHNLSRASNYSIQ